MLAYWHGNFSGDETSSVIMEDTIHFNIKDECESDNDNDNGYGCVKLILKEKDYVSGDKLWVAMLFRFDVGEIVIVKSTRHSVIYSFVNEFFDCIVESVLDNDNDVPDFDDKTNYMRYLAKHKLEMVFSKETLINYLLRQDGDVNLLLDVNGHLISVSLIIKQVTIMF